MNHRPQRGLNPLDHSAILLSCVKGIQNIIYRSINQNFFLYVQCNFPAKEVRVKPLLPPKSAARTRDLSITYQIHICAKTNIDRVKYVFLNQHHLNFGSTSDSNTHVRWNRMLIFLLLPFVVWRRELCLVNPWDRLLCYIFCCNCQSCKLYCLLSQKQCSHFHGRPKISSIKWMFLFS